jgi:Bor protein
MRPIIFMCCASLMLAGCAEHRLVVRQPNPNTQKEEVQSAATGWGTSQTKNVAVCDSNIIDEVRVKQNFGQSLLTVLTLGFYMPTTIEYQCGNPPSEPGSTDD